ncbi:MAG: hypothetical protein AAB646_02270 [Patescibacteria group bacterium]
MKRITFYFLLVILTFAFLFLNLSVKNAKGSHVSANISSLDSERYAWNDVIGWIDFGSGEVEVTNTQLKGYTANSQVGPISLDCATGPSGSSCAIPYGVANTNGVLSGWAWNDEIGWISFSGSSAQSVYGVTIDMATGIFSGWAWNDVIGWISFNCDNSGIGNTCASSDYKVRINPSLIPPPPPPGTGGGFSSGVSLTSSVFDTQVVQGAAFNTIMWKGNLNGGSVGFQIASSNSSSGPWNFFGPSGTNNDYYQPLEGSQMKIKATGSNHHNNKRYIRYKIFLDVPAAPGPQIEDVIISYSP